MGIVTDVIESEIKRICGSTGTWYRHMDELDWDRDKTTHIGVVWTGPRYDDPANPGHTFPGSIVRVVCDLRRGLIIGTLIMCPDIWVNSSPLFEIPLADPKCFLKLEKAFKDRIKVWIEDTT